MFKASELQSVSTKKGELNVKPQENKQQTL